MKKLLYIILILLPTLCFARHTGWQHPTDASGTDWTLPSRCISSNDVRTSYLVEVLEEGATEYLFAKDFNLVVVDGATIDSIIVRVEGYVDNATASNRIMEVGLSKNAANPVGDVVEITLPQTGENTDTPIEVRGSTNGRWNTTWTEDEVVNATFSVAVRRKVIAAIAAYIDNVQVLVYYDYSADYIYLDGQQGGATDMLDTFIDSLAPNTERGSETYMYVHTKDCSPTDTSTKSILMKFDLTGVSGTVNWVSLDLFRKVPITRSPQLYIYRLTRDWAEEATWDSATTGCPSCAAWTTKGGDFDASVIDSMTDTLPSTGKSFVYCQRTSGGLLDLFQGWTDETYPNYGILIKVEPTEDDTMSISTAGNINEYINPRPKLYVEYTPVAGGQSARRRIILSGGQ